jgi:ABC-2 type transport system ATP-binding protein
MIQPQLVVDNLSKTYHVPQRQAGIKAALGSMVRRSFQDVEAVRGVSFSVTAGEMVGFIGPNGAGKTTTLKMLTGLLHPSSGTARVNGFEPWQRHPDYLRQISMVLGNKSQMMWDIPPLDTFHVLGEIYRVPVAERDRTIGELSALLAIEPLLTKPVRNLSLGERMKCELVAALIHRPAVLFLDEPTLGLDVSMQRRLRAFIAEYNQRTGATIILTSHYMADVAELCPRVILIHHGQVIYDGQLDQLSERLAPFKLIRLTLNRDNGSQPPEQPLPPGAEIIARDNDHLTLRVARAQAAATTAHVLNTLPVADLAVENPPIEAVIDQIYQEGNV